MPKAIMAKRPADGKSWQYAGIDDLMMKCILFKIGEDEGLWLNRKIPGQTAFRKRL
jgi:hypothetical protein